MAIHFFIQVIHCMRNPKDVACSGYLFLRKMNIILQNASWDDFFNLFFTENSKFDIDVDLCEMPRGVYSVFCRDTVKSVTSSDKNKRSGQKLLENALKAQYRGAADLTRINLMTLGLIAGFEVIKKLQFLISDFPFAREDNCQVPSNLSGCQYCHLHNPE